MGLNKDVVCLAVLLMFVRPAICSKDVSYEIKQNYCPFFNNRAPMAQPGLKNCTWFKENSCCLQQEIEATFGRVKPLKGAKLSCQKYLNYLMCYICAPNQHMFYQNERLTVCEDFCDKFYQVCDTAILKGSPIKDLYSSGDEFCRSRRFLVSNSNCFNFDPVLDRNRASRQSTNWAVYCVVFIFISCLKSVSVFDSGNVLGTDNIFSKDRMYQRKITKKPAMATFINPQGRLETYVITGKDSFKPFTVLACMFIGFMVVPLQFVASKDTGGDLAVEDVKMWADSLETALVNLAKQGLQYDRLQETFSNVHYESTTVNGITEIMKIRNELVDFFTKKEGLAIQLAEKVSELYGNWKHEYSAYNITNLNDLPSAVYKDADVIRHFPQDQCIYDRRFKADVLLDSSSVKLADSVDRSDADVIDVVQLTAILDETFTENLQQHPDIRWQYFGSSSGVHRSYPASESVRNFVGFTEDFDPRSRPWYLSATSGTKDVVIVLDGSLSMAENGRLSRAKEVIRWILDTMTKSDRVNIVLSRSSHWDINGKQYEYRAEVLGCRKTGLLQATSNTRRELLSSLDSVVGKGGSNHTKAFALAFDLLESESVSVMPACNPLVLFLTDADERDGSNRCSKGYHKHYHDGTKEFVAGKLCMFKQENLQLLVNDHQENSTQKARVLTVIVDSSEQSAAVSSLGHLACDGGGLLLTVPRDADVYQSIQPYFEFVRDTTHPKRAVWTSPYLDKHGLGLMMTVSVPVISKSHNSVLGVVGVDVPLEKIESLLRHRMWGDVYAFLVDRSDLAAIVHPYAKPTAQLLDEPVFPPVTELETDKGKPKDFEEVVRAILQAETGELTITQNAVRPLTDQGLLWRPVEYTRYVYTDIPDSDFSIVMNLGMSGDSFPFKQTVERSGTMNYLSDMEEYAEYSKKFPGVYKALNTTTTAAAYTGVRISSSHSVVHLTPRAFCQPYDYILGHPNFTALHDYINSDGEQGEECVTGTYKRDVWSDVQLTSKMEDTWQDRKQEVSSSVLWTYIATDSGVMRIYPGVRIHSTYDPTVRTWYRGCKESSSVHTSYVYLNTLPHATKVVTFSKSVQRPSSSHQHCTDEHSECTGQSVQAVVAMDVHYKHVESLVDSLRSQFSHKYCGMSYVCGEGDFCHTKCYLVTGSGYLTYAGEISGLSDWPADQYEAVSLASRHGYLFNKLLRANVFTRHHRHNYQAVCKHVPDSKLGGNAPSFEEDPLRKRGPIPPYNNEYSCVGEEVFYAASQSVLRNTSFVLSGHLDADPCGDGTYHLLTLPSMDLFLLVIEDYRPVDRDNFNCHIANSVLKPGSYKLEEDLCPTFTAFHQSAGARPCVPPQAEAACGWSGAASLIQEQVTLLICWVLLSAVS